MAFGESAGTERSPGEHQLDFIAGVTQYSRMTATQRVAISSSSNSPLEAFAGTIQPTKTAPLYSAGLAVVAFAMVLLPLLYVGLIGFTGWGVIFHLKTNTWILESESGRAGFFRFILYLGPAIAGGILVFFMVKPFFAPKAKSSEPVTLDPAHEPLLFQFVAKICRLVGSSVPSRIDVDCDVNASAALKRGFWSRDLVLTIGLPLAAGLDMRQFAGVLAHEFGHFAQGAGMRLTYVIRRVNFWFARVVYERDEWDVQLEQSAKTGDLRIGVILHLARACIWLSRKVLWALMQTGNAISCFMLRQMEYDADSYEAKLAGSDAFAETASRLRILNVAIQSSFEYVKETWINHRLPENLPSLIQYKAGCLPAEVHQKLTTAAAAEKTGWFDTHPCDSDRIQAARSLKEPGIFRLTDPATALFSDFDALSKQVTRHEYESRFELEFSDETLINNEEALRDSAASAQAEAMIAKYYGTVPISLKPLLEPTQVPALTTGGAIMEEWQTARNDSDALRSRAEESSKECVQLQNRLSDLTIAHYLLKAGFLLKPREFGLPETAVSMGDQMNGVASGMEETRAAILKPMETIEPFQAALRQRVTLALGFLLADPATSPERVAEVSHLAKLLGAVAVEMLTAHSLGAKLNAFRVLGMNRDSKENPEELDNVAFELAGTIQKEVSGLRDRLNALSYPFPNSQGQSTVAEYLRSGQPAENDLQRSYLEGCSHVERLFALHFRLLGRVLAETDSAEASLEVLHPQSAQELRP